MPPSRKKSKVQDEQPVASALAEQKERQTGSASYDSVLLFEPHNGPKKVIGQYGTEAGLSCVSVKSTCELQPNWAPYIFLNLNLRHYKPVSNGGAGTEFTNSKQWLIRVTAAETDLQATLYHYAPSQEASTMTDDDRFHNDLFNTHFSTSAWHKLQTAKDYGRLFVLRLKIHPNRLRHEGIVVEDQDLGIHQDVHDYMFNLLTKSCDEPCQLNIFYLGYNQDHTLANQVEEFEQYAKIDQTERHFRAWFNKSKGKLVEVQVGQVTEKDERPKLKTLDHQRSFENMEQFATVNGFAVIEDSEEKERVHEESRVMQVEFRLLKVTAGQDNEYLAFARFPKYSGFQIKDDTDAEVYFGNDPYPNDDDPKWKAVMVPNSFPLQAGEDVAMLLKRPYLRQDKEVARGPDNEPIFDPFQFKEVLSLADNDPNLATRVQKYLRDGTPTKGYFLVTYSDKTNMNILKALRLINPHHGKGDEKTVTIWNKLLLGQDLRAHFFTDIFEDPGLHTNLAAITPQLNPEQQTHILKTLTAMPNGLGLVQGGAGTGKTLLDIATALLMVKQGKKVLFLGPTNSSVDDYATKIYDLFVANGLKDPKVVRYHTYKTERSLADIKAMKDGEEPEDNPRYWSDVPPEAELLWEKAAFDLMNARQRTPGGVRDRRMKIIERSMGMAVLMRVRYIGPHAKGPSLFGPDPTRQDPPHVRDFIEMFNKWHYDGPLDKGDRMLLRACYNTLVAEIFTEASVVVTTLVNSSDSSLVKSFNEDLVIHLEAGKVALETLIGLAFHPHPTILSGDRMQLRPFPREKEACGPFRNQWNRSLMEGWIDMGYKTTTLTQQHRSIPQICNLVSKIFYDGAMVPMSLPENNAVRIAKKTHKELYKIEHPIAFVNIVGSQKFSGHTRTRYNEIEVDAVVEYLYSMLSNGAHAAEITVITGYQGQLKLLLKTLSEEPKFADVTVTTADSYQGQQNHHILLSVTSTGSLGFMNDPRRLNVVISRAERSLTILSNIESLNLANRKEKKFQAVFQYFCDLGAYQKAHSPPDLTLSAFARREASKRDYEAMSSSDHWLAGPVAITTETNVEDAAPGAETDTEMGDGVLIPNPGTTNWGGDDIDDTPPIAVGENPVHGW